MTQEFPNKAELIAEFNAARNKADQYRARSDEAIKKAKADRDPDTVKNSYAVLAGFVVTAQKVWNQVLSSTSAMDPELSRLSNIRILAWNMRDTRRAGTRRDRTGAVGQSGDSARESDQNQCHPRGRSPHVAVVVGQSENR